MAIRNIVGESDGILKKKSRPVINFDDRLATLLDDMAETMHNAHGVGLAAVQVGVLRRALVVDVGEGLIEMVNPEIVDSSDAMLEESEGCLSFPGLYGIVPRPEWVEVKACDRNGKPVKFRGEGFMARAFCHEIDHLNGVVFKDLAIRMLEPDER